MQVAGLGSEPAHFLAMITGCFGRLRDDPIVNIRSNENKIEV